MIVFCTGSQEKSSIATQSVDLKHPLGACRGRRQMGQSCSIAVHEEPHREAKTPFLPRTLRVSSPPFKNPGRCVSVANHPTKILVNNAAWLLALHPAAPTLSDLVLSDHVQSASTCNDDGRIHSRPAVPLLIAATASRSLL